MYMVKKMGGDTRAQDMLWFACLSYLAPGWIASLVLFTNSLLMFLLFHRFVGRARRPAEFGVRLPAS
jgi:hypothetical protein